MQCYEALPNVMPRSPLKGPLLELREPKELDSSLGVILSQDEANKILEEAIGLLAFTDDMEELMKSLPDQGGHI